MEERNILLEREINRSDFERLYLKPPMTKWAQSRSCIEPGAVCWRVSLQSSDQYKQLSIQPVLSVSPVVWRSEGCPNWNRLIDMGGKRANKAASGQFPNAKEGRYDRNYRMKRLYLHKWILITLVPNKQIYRTCVYLPKRGRWTYRTEYILGSRTDPGQQDMASPIGKLDSMTKPSRDLTCTYIFVSCSSSSPPFKRHHVNWTVFLWACTCGWKTGGAACCPWGCLSIYMVVGG